jgi:hypothetical protein
LNGKIILIFTNFYLIVIKISKWILSNKNFICNNLFIIYYKLLNILVLMLKLKIKL